jgi:hypothetical protein
VVESALIPSTNVLPHIGQLPGVSRTISECIGQLYLTVRSLLLTDSDVLQPVKAGIATPSTSVIRAIVFQFIFSIMFAPLF